MRKNPLKRLGSSERDAEDIKKQSFFRVRIWHWQFSWKPIRRLIDGDLEVEFGHSLSCTFIVRYIIGMWIGRLELTWISWRKSACKAVSCVGQWLQEPSVDKRIHDFVHLTCGLEITAADCCCWFCYIGWRRGSVFRTSVFGWRTFPDLYLTYDHFVGKVSAMGHLTRRTQPSIPPGR